MILIHCQAARLRNGMSNPKTYPWWPELLESLGAPTVQVAAAGDDVFAADCRMGLPLRVISELLRACNYWIAIDSFLPHLAHHLPKPGVVLWSKSDPRIFGYPENLNLLKDRRYLRARQFRIWEEESFDPEAFLSPAAVIEAVQQWRTIHHGELLAVES